MSHLWKQGFSCFSQVQCSVKTCAEVQGDSSALQKSNWNKEVKKGVKLDTAASVINKPGVYLKMLRENQEHSGKLPSSLLPKWASVSTRP